MSNYTGDLPMTDRSSAFDQRISRRQLLRTAAVGSGIAVLAATTSNAPVFAAPAQQAAGGKEFHGAWPYEVPPTGHFNYMQGITHAILRDGIYYDLITLPMALY